MPHVVQPGGGGGKMRVRYTARRKRGLVAASRRMQAEGMSLRAAASELCVSATNLSKWVSQGVGKIYHLGKEVEGISFYVTYEVTYCNKGNNLLAIDTLLPITNNGYIALNVVLLIMKH